LQPNGASAEQRLLRWTIFCPDWVHLPAEKSIIRPLTAHNRHRYF